MKVILLMAITLDGKIGKDSEHFPNWTGKADKKLFVKMTKDAGAIIMGNSTFKTIGKPLPGRKNIIMTHDPHKSTWDNLEYTDYPPKEILKALKEVGYKEVILAGGAQINSLFAKDNLIDEVVLTISPLIFGKGISIFNDGISLKLELQNVRQLDGERIVAKYKVKK